MKNKNQVIGLMGNQGSGKSWAARQARKALPNLVQDMSIATPIKYIVANLLQLLGEERWPKDKTKTYPELGGLSYRELCQKIGSFGRNEIDQDIWLNLSKKVIENSDKKRLVIDDIRYQNEADLVQKHFGGEIILISNGGYEKQEDDHESEVEWKSVWPDYQVENSDEALELIKKLVLRDPKDKS